MEALKSRMVAGVRFLDAGDGKFVPPVLMGADPVLTVEEHESRLSEIRSRMTDINAEAAGRQLTEAQRAEWNQLGEEREQTVATIEELRARQAVIEELNESPESRESGASFSTRRAGAAVGDDIWDLSTVRMTAANPRAAAGELRSRAMRAIEMAHFPQDRALTSPEDARSHIARLLDADPDVGDFDGGEFARRLLITGSPLYRKAFFKTLAGQSLSPEEQRAFSIGSTGNYPVPYTLDPTIVPTSNSVVNPLRQISRIVQVTGNTWKGVTSGAITAAYTAEATEASDNTPTLLQPTINVEKAQAFVPFSIEVDQDWSAVQAEMATLFADAKDDLEATKFALGAGHGSNEPQGVLVGGTTAIDTATASVFADDDLYSVEEALPPRFRPRAQWIANRAVYNKVRQFDTYGGAMLWKRIGEGLANAPTGNTGAEVLGYPANELSTMATDVTTGAGTIAMFGDFRHFVIVDRVGMNVELIPHLFATGSNFPSGQRGLYAYWRNSSGVIAPNAFRKLKIKA